MLKECWRKERVLEELEKLGVLIRGLLEKPGRNKFAILTKDRAKSRDGDRRVGYTTGRTERGEYTGGGG